MAACAGFTRFACFGRLVVKVRNHIEQSAGRILGEYRRIDIEKLQLHRFERLRGKWREQGLQLAGRRGGFSKPLIYCKFVIPANAGI